MRIDADIPASPAHSSRRRSIFKGAVVGSMLSAAMAATLLISVIRSNEDQIIVSDVVSAHLRSIKTDHLTDVQTGDGQAVGPWFDGRIKHAPPVPDLAALGFALIGARLDYVQGQAVAALVYRRSDHIINVFVAPGTISDRGPELEALQGVNVALWSAQGFRFCAVGDVDPSELKSFSSEFAQAAKLGA